MDADDWKPPSWWKPWSDFPGLLAATRHTVARLGDEPFMTWLDDKCREELTISFNDVWNQSAAIAVLMKQDPKPKVRLPSPRRPPPRKKCSFHTLPTCVLTHDRSHTRRRRRAN